jgi:hypothetical protein
LFTGFEEANIREIEEKKMVQQERDKNREIIHHIISTKEEFVLICVKSLMKLRFDQDLLIMIPC